MLYMSHRLNYGEHRADRLLNLTSTTRFCNSLLNSLNCIDKLYGCADPTDAICLQHLRRHQSLHSLLTKSASQIAHHRVACCVYDTYFKHIIHKLCRFSLFDNGLFANRRFTLTFGKPQQDLGKIRLNLALFSTRYSAVFKEICVKDANDDGNQVVASAARQRSAH